MTAVQFSIAPKPLADILANAVEISKEKSGVEPLAPHVMLSYQPSPDGKAGMVTAYGVGRYAAGRSTVYTEGLPSTESGTVCLTHKHAAALQTQLRGVLGGKQARAHVMISPTPVQVTVKDEYGMEVQSWANLHIAAAGETVADLLDSDPEGASDAWFDQVDELLAGVSTAALGPLAFQPDIISRLAKLRTDGSVLDLKLTAHPDLIGVALGTQFRGVIGAIGREGYAAGGPWGDGPGTPAHLF